MLPLVTLVLLIGSRLVAAIDDSDTQEHWDTYKEKFNKTYDSPEEEDVARDNFENNLLHAALHNLEDEQDYDKGVHEYSDMTPQQQVQALCKTVVPENITERNFKDFSISERGAPYSRDLRQEGYVSKVRNQGGCGSCWAFATAGAVECLANKAWHYNNWEWVMGPQQLVDCTSNGNVGCRGGWPNTAMDYIQKNGKGIIEEYQYPYTEKDGTCSVKDDCNHFKISGHADVSPVGSEDAVKNAVAENGCLTACIVVGDNFMGYSDGVFYDPNYKDDQGVNHAILICGYGTENGNDYWIIKNSWGESWGEDGYMKLARNRGNHLKIASYVSYPYGIYC